MMCQSSCTEFSDILASSAPVPGGGGASAYVGALAAALGEMVSNLTIGKKKYAAVEADVRSILSRLTDLRAELIRLVDADAEGFAPLAAAYALPRETEAEQAERARVMEEALQLACEAPVQIMTRCAEVIELQGQLCNIGSALAKSDVGVGVALAKAAMVGASLNIIINAKSMTNAAAAQALRTQVDGMLASYGALADRILTDVIEQIS